MAVRRYGGITVPVLITDDGVFNDSTDILHQLDGEHQLWPTEPALLQEAEAFEALCDKTLGPHVRRLAYDHLLPYRRLLIPTATQGAPFWQRCFLSLFLPLVRPMFRKSLNINPESVLRSHQRVSEVFDQVESLLADGRRYLFGGRFSAADLTFAALASPMIWPDEFAGGLPPFESLPAPMREMIEEYRGRPAGSFALRLYREDRN